MSTEIDDDITLIKNSLRDLDIAITNSKNTNSVTATVRRCTNRFWNISDELVPTYEPKIMTPAEAIKNIENIEFDMERHSTWHKSLLAHDISNAFDALFLLVKLFCQNIDERMREANWSREEAANEEATAKRRALNEEAKAKRQAEEAERQEWNRKRKLEEAQDLVAKDTWSAARLKLAGDLGTVGKTYQMLVSRFTDTNFGKKPSSPNYLHDGQILGGLIKLTDYMTTQSFKRSEDTYHCCELLRDCTCYLACDGKYKRPGRLSKDDRFAGIYKANSEFRREWVAFLRQLVGYVEMLYEGEDAAKNLYLNRYKLADMHNGVDGSFWLSRHGYPAYDWERIKQDITTAEEGIRQEPEPTKSRWQSVQDWMARLGEEHQGEDVPALLAQLQALGRL
jgi:hypothetical protein